MNIYTARATCDWGGIFEGKPIKASTFGTAFARAGKMAYKEARRRPKSITVTLHFVGSEKRIEAMAAEDNG